MNNGAICLIISWLLVIHSNANCQIADGTVAPDFTLTDYYGTEHNLYSYLDDGKTAFVEIFAAHCPSCWNYHQSNKLKDLYNAYGPNGTDELMVFALEYDQYNGHDAFVGIGDPWTTQGNWLDGTPYPIFDVEWPDRGVFTDYNVTGHPVVYMVCPDRIVERVFTSESVAQLYEKVQACQNISSIEESENEVSIYVNQVSKRLIIDSDDSIETINIYNLQGQLIRSNSNVNLSLDELISGVYLFEIRTEKANHFRKLYLN
jgi:hypothetical protein